MKTTHITAGENPNVDPFDAASNALRSAGVDFEVIADFDVGSAEVIRFDHAA